MPRLSDSMEEGTIIKWLKQPGDQVRSGEPLADIETDKATVTYEADAEGFLQILAREGDTLAIGATIARLLADAESAKRDTNGETPSPASPSTPNASPNASLTSSSGETSSLRAAVAP